MSLRGTFVWGVLILCPMWLSAQSAVEKLRAEPALQKSFTRTFEATPISELLSVFSKETGVNLSAGHRTANDMVVLVVREKSYAEVLEKLANHFGFTWELQTVGTSKQYLLTQTSEAVAEETKARAKQELARLEKARQAIAKEAKLTEKELAEYRTKILEWYAKEPKVNWEEAREQQDPEEWRETPEERAWYEWRSAPEALLIQQLRPDRQAVVRFLAGLSDRDWAQLLNGTPITYCTAPRPTQRRLPISWLPNTREWIRLFEAQGSVRPDDIPELPSEERLRVETLPSFRRVGEWEEGPPDPSHGYYSVSFVSLQIMMYGSSSSPFVRNARSFAGVKARLVALGPQREPLYYEEYDIEEYVAWATPPGLPGSEDASEQAEPRKEYRDHPILGKPFKAPSAYRGLGSLDQGEQAQSMKSLLRDIRTKGVLGMSVTPIRHAIAESAGTSLISDAYLTPVSTLTASVFAGGTQNISTVGRALDVLKDEGTLWQLEDRWITLRTEDWAYWRHRQIPPKVLDQLSKVLVSPQITLDELARLAAVLSEPQMSKGSAYETFFTFISQGRALESLFDRQGRCMLRMWNALSTAQKDALRAGARVPLDAMMPAAKDAVQLLVQVWEPSSFTSALSQWEESPFETIVDEATIVDEVGRRLVARKRGPFAEPTAPYDWSEYLPEKTPFPICVSLERKNIPGFYIAAQIAGEDEHVYGTEMPAWQLAWVLEAMGEIEEESERFGMRVRFGRLVADEYVFRVHLTADIAITTRVGLTSRVPNSEFTRDNMPADVKELLEKAKKHRESLGSPDWQPGDEP